MCDQISISVSQESSRGSLFDIYGCMRRKFLRHVILDCFDSESQLTFSTEAVRVCFKCWDIIHLSHHYGRILFVPTTRPQENRAGPGLPRCICCSARGITADGQSCTVIILPTLVFSRVHLLPCSHYVPVGLPF